MTGFQPLHIKDAPEGFEENLALFLRNEIDAALKRASDEFDADIFCMLPVVFRLVATGLMIEDHELGAKVARLIVKECEAGVRRDLVRVNKARSQMNTAMDRLLNTRHLRHTQAGSA